MSAVQQLPLPVVFAGSGVVAYLIGAIPFALIVGRLWRGIDLRQHGSGNLGATNTMRVLGVGPGVIVFALDMTKGAAGVAVGWWLVQADMREWAGLICGLAAIAGHSYSPYIGLRGGKGVATGAGVVLWLTPLTWLIMLGGFIIIVALTRMVSLGSVVIAILFPLLTVWLYPDRSVTIGFAVVATILVVWRHRTNIARILKGQEPRLGDSPSAQRLV